MVHLRTMAGGRALRAVEMARSAVVRFRVTARSVERIGTLTDGGSGVLVDGGRHLLVAGHVLDSLAGKPDLKMEAFQGDGTRRQGKLPAVRGGEDGAPEGDWGLVELEGDPPEGCPSLRMGEMTPDSTVVMVGYSGSFGIDARGRALPAMELMESPLAPLVFVGRVTDARKGEIELVAGMGAAGGASGGAIINLEGDLVGLMVSTKSGWQVGEVIARGGGIIRPLNHERDMVTGKDFEVELGFTGTPVGVFREFLLRRWER